MDKSVTNCQWSAEIFVQLGGNNVRVIITPPEGTVSNWVSPLSMNDKGNCYEGDPGRGVIFMWTCNMGLKVNIL